MSEATKAPEARVSIREVFQVAWLLRLEILVPIVLWVAIADPFDLTGGALRESARRMFVDDSGFQLITLLVIAVFLAAAIRIPTRMKTHYLPDITPQATLGATKVAHFFSWIVPIGAGIAVGWPFLSLAIENERFGGLALGATASGTIIQFQESINCGVYGFACLIPFVAALLIWKVPEEHDASDGYARMVRGFSAASEFVVVVAFFAVVLPLAFSAWGAANRGDWIDRYVARDWELILGDAFNSFLIVSIVMVLTLPLALDRSRNLRVLIECIALILALCLPIFALIVPAFDAAVYEAALVHAIACGFYAYLWLTILNKLDSDSAEAKTPDNSRWGFDWLLVNESWGYWYVGVLLAAVAVFVVSLEPLPLFRGLRSTLSIGVGSLSIVIVWATVALVMFTPIAYVANRSGVPFLAILLVVAVLITVRDLNDNHKLRLIEATGEPAGRYGESLTLENWLKSRPDAAAYENYPVVVVATEGGGLRAAYVTANVLAALQDMCPMLSQHIVAVHGVSGGSLGAAVFAGLAADHAQAQQDPRPCDFGGAAPRRLQDAAGAALSGDLLAPLLGATLFPDAFQRVFPVPVARWDRAVSLEKAMEASWDSACVGDKCKPGRMAAPFGALFDNPKTAVAVPHLVLQSTDVETGRVIPISTAQLPFEKLSTDIALGLAKVTSCPDPIQTQTPSDAEPRAMTIALSTAAFASARFPYLAPPARIDLCKDGRLTFVRRIVDGGYFENSGSLLAGKLVRRFLSEKFAPGASDAAKRAQIILLLIRSSPTCPHGGDGPCEDKMQINYRSLPETLSPLRALFATQRARTEYAREDARDTEQLLSTICRGATDAKGGAPAVSGCDRQRPPLVVVDLKFNAARGASIPLTWTLSSKSLEQMNSAVNAMRNEDRKKPKAGTESGEERSSISGSVDTVLCALTDYKDNADIPSRCKSEPVGS